MGTRIAFTQLGPSASTYLPVSVPMGLSFSVGEQQGCWSKPSLKGDKISSSCAASTASSLCSWRVCSSSSPSAKTLAAAPVTCSSSQRTKIAHAAQVGKGCVPSLMRHRMRRGQNYGSSGPEKVKVRSLVDEATAHSSDMELGTSSETSERNEGKSSEELETRDEALFTREEGKEVEEEEYIDSTESSASSSEFGEGYEDMEIVEAAPPNPIEMDYEDMKVGQIRNWSLADMRKVDMLRNFEYRVGTENGVLVVQALRVEHMKAVEELLVDSFAELMGGLLTYRPLLTLTVRQYVRDRYSCLPDAVTLVGLYAPAEDNVVLGRTENSESSNWLLAGTVELSFSNVGHPDIPAGPSPPPGSPYLCNMAVNSAYRRRGIGRQLLKAAEELAASQECEDMYLHCRMVDMAPLNMYQGAGYQIVATDSILSLLSFQRRRYLMKKRLHPPNPISNSSANEVSQ